MSSFSISHTFFCLIFRLLYYFHLLLFSLSSPIPPVIILSHSSLLRSNHSLPSSLSPSPALLQLSPDLPLSLHPSSSSLFPSSSLCPTLQVYLLLSSPQAVAKSSANCTIWSLSGATAPTASKTSALSLSHSHVKLPFLVPTKCGREEGASDRSVPAMFSLAALSVGSGSSIDIYDHQSVRYSRRDGLTVCQITDDSRRIRQQESDDQITDDKRIEKDNGHDGDDKK